MFRKAFFAIPLCIFVSQSDCFFVAQSQSILRADWPGLLGPTRNGIADSETVLPTSLPKELKPIWALDAGQGYAGAAIREKTVVLFERKGEKDQVQMLDLASAKLLWQRDLPARYKGGVNADKGPRCVPTVLDDSVIVFSAAGDLTCLARKDGTERWTRALRTEYQADEGYFGAGSTPLVVGDRIIANSGGKKGSIICVSLADGKTIWTASQGEASYASPILYQGSELNAKPIVIVPTRLTTIGLDPTSGKELWQIPFGQRGPTVNAATPIVTASGKVFMTASYGIGTVTFKPTVLKAGTVAKGEQIYSQYATPLSIGDKIFGSDGREDMGTGSYKCLAETDGSLVWEEPSMPICHTIGVKEKLLIVGIDGRVWCQNTASQKFQPEWGTTLPKGVYRALPALSENFLVVKSSDDAKAKWIAVQLK